MIIKAMTLNETIDTKHHAHTKKQFNINAWLCITSQNFIHPFLLMNIYNPNNHSTLNNYIDFEINTTNNK
jgi:hypothetical protein